ncbi:hypothetical protein ACFX13_040982 [Malus domestica]
MLTHSTLVFVAVKSNTLFDSQENSPQNDVVCASAPEVKLNYDKSSSDGASFSSFSHSNASSRWSSGALSQTSRARPDSVVPQ